MHSWPHAPARVEICEGPLIVTSATYKKQPHFKGDERLRLLQDCLFKHCDDLAWKLQAWAIFPNHYHFVAVAPPEPDLKRLLKRIHGSSANALNQMDSDKGRMVWYRYWDTQITSEKSYYARLAYVNNNAVRHGVVADAEIYPYCSASWFASRADRVLYKTVMSFPIDRVRVIDDF